MKPKVLYHASVNKNLEDIKPRADTARDKNEGSVVFASPDKAGVTKFIVPSDDSWTRKMRFGNVHVHVINDRQRYEEADKGGAIYHLSPDTIELDKTKSGGRNEWTSKVAVTPIDKEEYDSGLQVQLDNGVQIFFVDKEIFDSINKSHDYGNTIIRNLESENKKQEKNCKKVPIITRELKSWN